MFKAFSKCFTLDFPNSNEFQTFTWMKQDFSNIKSKIITCFFTHVQYFDHFNWIFIQIKCLKNQNQGFLIFTFKFKITHSHGPLLECKTQSFLFSNKFGPCLQYKSQYSFKTKGAITVSSGPLPLSYKSHYHSLLFKYYFI